MKLPLLAVLIFLSFSLSAQITNHSQWTWMKGDSISGRYGIYGTQGIEDAANNPGSRLNSLYWKDASGNFWLFGGAGFSASGSQSGELNDLWKYDPASNQWAWMNGSGETDLEGSYGIKGVADIANYPGGRD